MPTPLFWYLILTTYFMVYVFKITELCFYAFMPLCHSFLYIPPTSLPGPSLQRWAASWGVSTTSTGSQHDGYLQRHCFLFFFVLFSLCLICYFVFSPCAQSSGFLLSICAALFFFKRILFGPTNIVWKPGDHSDSSLPNTGRCRFDQFSSFLTFWIIFQGTRPTVNDADINASLAFLAPFAADWARAPWFLSWYREQQLLGWNIHSKFALRKTVQKNENRPFLGLQQNPLCANSLNSNSHTILHIIDFDKFNDFFNAAKVSTKAAYLRQ